MSQRHTTNNDSEGHRPGHDLSRCLIPGTPLALIITVPSVQGATR
jgi:hypothetical protein